MNITIPFLIPPSLRLCVARPVLFVGAARDTLFLSLFL